MYAVFCRCVYSPEPDDCTELPQRVCGRAYTLNHDAGIPINHAANNWPLYRGFPPGLELDF